MEDHKNLEKNLKRSLDILTYMRTYENTDKVIYKCCFAKYNRYSIDNWYVLPYINLSNLLCLCLLLGLVELNLPDGNVLLLEDVGQVEDQAQQAGRRTHPP